METININGTEYVPKSEEPNYDYVIVRARSAGVFAGYLKSKDGDEVVLTNARKLWFWEGGAAVQQISVDGISKPDECKFPCEVKEQYVREWIEILPATEKAKDSIQSVPVWSE